MKKILIFGGGGFIGLEIAKHLSVIENNEVTIVDIFSNKTKNFVENQKKFQINIIDADLTLKESFAKLESSYDYLYMLASVVGVNKCISFPHEVIRINTLIIQNTLDWLTKGNVKRFFFLIQ